MLYKLCPTKVFNCSWRCFAIDSRCFLSFFRASKTLDQRLPTLCPPRPREKVPLNKRHLRQSSPNGSVSNVESSLQGMLRLALPFDLYSIPTATAFPCFLPLHKLPSLEHCHHSWNLQCTFYTSDLSSVVSQSIPAQTLLLPATYHPPLKKFT
jgi:hypothetical protein